MPTEIRLSYPARKMQRRASATAKVPELVCRGTWGQPRADGWKNRLIHAENLGALHSLCDDPQVVGRVTLAYLDPPFATGREYRAGRSRTATVSSSRSDSVAYDDRLRSVTYLEFLRQRLRIVRELLADDGSLYVHIGPQMSHYVKVLLDEIFGAEHFLNEITRVKCNPKNFRRAAFGNVKDSLLFYTKTGRHVWNEAREPMTPEDILRLFPRLDNDGRRYTTTPLHAPGETRNGPTGEAWKRLHPPNGRHWRYTPAELTRLDRQGLIEWSSNGNPRKKIYADDVIRTGRKRQDIWIFKDSSYPSYPTEKNLRLLETIILCSSNPNDLVMDCFAGSGTALVAAERHGRRWIGIDASAIAIRTAQHRLEALEGYDAFGLYRAASRHSARGRTRQRSAV
jgi:adenine-specific DNA-methyltransferase